MAPEIFERAARALAAADGYEWQDRPNAVAAKKQGRYAAKARAVLALVEAEHDRRVTDLLEANNRYLERARTAERHLAATLQGLKALRHVIAFDKEGDLDRDDFDNLLAGADAIIAGAEARS